jgi:prevent-host-death family protein
MTIIMVMIMVNIADAKARLSEFLEAVERGEHVVICKRNQPVAELRAVAPAARTTPRDLAPMFPGWKIDPAFFEPLSDEEIAEWEGRGPADPLQVAGRPLANRRRRTKPRNSR